MARSAGLAGIAVADGAPQAGWLAGPLCPRGPCIVLEHCPRVIEDSLLGTLKPWVRSCAGRSGKTRSDAEHSGTQRRTAAHSTVVAKTRKRAAKTRKGQRSP